MSRRSDVFSLEDLYLLQREGDWPTEGEVFLKPPYNHDWQYGYIAAGYTPSARSTVARIDFANDGILQSFRTNLGTARYDPQGTGSKTHGYIQGGATPTVISSTEKLPRFEKRQKEIDTPGHAKKQKASNLSHVENKKKSSLEDDMSL